MTTSYAAQSTAAGADLAPQTLILTSAQVAAQEAKAAKMAKAAKVARINRREQLSRKIVHIASVATAVSITGILIYIVLSVLRHPIAGTTASAPVIAAGDPVPLLSVAPVPHPAPVVKVEAPKAPVVAAVIAPAAPAAPELAKSVAGRFVLSANHKAITITNEDGKDITLALTHPIITFDHQAIDADGLKGDLAVNVLYTGSEATLIEQTTPPPPVVAATSTPTPAPVVAQAANDKPKKKKNKKNKKPAPPAAATGTTPAAM